jgi:hypothetical protein
MVWLANIKPREIAIPSNYPDNFALLIAFTNLEKVLPNNDDTPPVAPPANETYLATLRNDKAAYVILPAAIMPYTAGPNANEAIPKIEPAPIMIPP